MWASDRLVSSLDYSYVGRSFSANNISGANGFATRERPSYALLNARVALMLNSWEVALVGKNLTNEHANLADSRSIAAETPGRPRIIREPAADDWSRVPCALLKRDGEVTFDENTEAPGVGYLASPAARDAGLAR